MASEAQSAASALIQSWGRHVSPRSHAVWVRNTIDNDTGETESEIVVAVNPVLPRGSQPFQVPSSFNGFRVVRAPWGQVDRVVAPEEEQG